MRLFKFYNLGGCPVNLPPTTMHWRRHGIYSMLPGSKADRL